MAYLSKFLTAAFVEWKDCETDTPFYEIMDVKLADAGFIYRIKSQREPYAYWVDENRIKTSKACRLFNVDLPASLALVNTEHLEAITLTALEVPAIVSETLQAWRDVRGTSIVLFALLFAGLLKLIHIKG